MPLPGGAADKIIHELRARVKRGRLALADEPDIIACIGADIETLGLVGETDSGTLAYLCYTSRKLPKPNSFVVMGPSGSGKSEIQLTPSRMMPTEDIVEATTMTPMSMYYDKPGTYRHKIVLAGERSFKKANEQANYTAVCRQLTSEGRCTHRVTLSDGKGGFKTVVLNVDGPIVFCETTTQPNIFDEDLNRCFQINASADPEVTRQVCHAIADRFMRPDSHVREAQQAVVIQLHQEFQRKLCDYPVTLPYAGLIADKLPMEKVAVRRAITRTFTIVQIITLLHQFSRKRVLSTGEGGPTIEHLEATIEDYAAARRFVLGPMYQALKDKGDHANYVERVKRASRLPAGEFDTSLALALWKLPNRAHTIRWLTDLVQGGMVEKVEQGHGRRPDRWRKVDADDTVLPTVDQVRKEMGVA